MKIPSHFHRIPLGARLLVALAVFVATVMFAGWSFGAAFDRSWVASTAYACLCVIFLAVGRWISQGFKNDLEVMQKERDRS